MLYVNRWQTKKELGFDELCERNDMKEEVDNQVFQTGDSMFKNSEVGRNLTSSESTEFTMARGAGFH